MKKLLSITLALVLCACGGGGGDKKSPPVSEKPVLTGVLIDSPVGNIAYRSETRNGFTSNEGKFRYLAGEMVVFFIGDLEFPAVKGASVITPWDIVSGTTATDITTRNNILRLLQTLDNDGNPDNGIFIYPEAAAAFQDITYTIDSPTFEADVAADLNEISPGLTLVTEADANAHFATTMKKNLLGSWVLAYGSARSVITFIDESRYIVIHEHENVDDLQEEGTVEYGEYSWDPLTGRFDVLAVLDESDGSGGLYGSADDEPPASQTLTLSGDTLKLVKENGTFSVSRVINASNPLVGAWLYSTVDTDDINVLTFLSATDYVLAHTRNDGVYQNREPRTSRPLSGEFGRYSLDGEDFSVLAAHVDSDGDGGLFNAEAESPQANTGKQLQLESGNMLVLIDDGEPGYFSRIGYGGYAVDEGIVFADYFHAGEIGDTWQFNNDWDFGLSAATKFPGFYQREAGDMFYKVNQDKSLSFVFGDAETGEIYTGWSFDMAARIDEGVIYQAMPGEQCVLTRLNEISVQAGVFIDVVREVCVDEESPVNQENAVYAPYSDFGVSSVIWYARGVGPVKYLLTHYADDLPNDLAELVSTTVVP